MRTVFGLVANAGYVLAVQILALVTLDPADYGAFSLQYLVFALGSSLSLSLISEAWLRHDTQSGVRSPWRDYGNATLFLALSLGGLTVIVSALVPALSDVAVIGALAVAASVYRVSVRYYAVRCKAPVLVSDLSGLVVTVAVWVWFAVLGDWSLLGMSTAWALGAVASALTSRLPPLPSVSLLRSWFSDKRTHIRPLLRDSVLMDAGAIGTPYLLAPLLGVAQFGTYRAVSNVAAPVRLVLTPLRPKIAMLAQEPQTLKRHALVVAAAVLLALCAYGALVVISVAQLDLGTLNELGNFALPTAIFVAANFLGTFHYIVARAGLNGTGLLLGRLVQTVFAIAGPLIGFAVGGLGGAIWGYALVTVVSAVTWAVLVSRPRWRSTH
ncbi:hypothetical protein FVA74_04045 [Salinibacterium sp. dk2585]|uniref:hypothetical protein n=1 Tax=unclassified Salinibacterium TaxID=2632331 RepID=UPI0011C242A1|nr:MULTISPECIES: hypothetical protein [unclassified Salinibacterium]QEE60840.1 hypothetical protein FVA74_04045 [Salinibacterium sp. dk2585]TXK55912.1 hypothetical protein FVP63_04190 [Salinibacterium sp. dk5596]